MHKTNLLSVNESLRRQFESDWLSGSASQVEDYLPPADDPLYLGTLEELVHIDLEFAWKKATADTTGNADSPPRVESYLQRFPPLNDPEIVLRLVQQEFRVRQLFAEAPGVDEFRQRFGETVIPDDVLETALMSARPAAAAGSQETAPEAIDRYHINGELGRGGFGIVWRATDPKLGREVAVKQLSPQLSADESHRQRFLNEARVSARLEHPGIVPVHDMGSTDEQRPYYTMKSVQGQTLADAITAYHQGDESDSARSVRQVRLLNAFLAVAKAMQYAHAQGIVHRDLKPQNILLGEFGETIILDWGLAKVLAAPAEKETVDPSPSTHADQPEQTREGTVQGTPAYMAPEQAEGRVGDVDQRCDTYALGVILYQLLTGKLPFTGTSFDEIKRQITTTEPVAPRAVDRRVPVSLDAICRKAMARAPADRYGSAAELVEELERYFADEPVSAAREPWSVRLARWMRKRKTFVAAAASIAIVALIAATVIAILQTANNRALRAANTKERDANQRATQRDEKMAALLADPIWLVDIGRPLEEAENAAQTSVSLGQSLTQEYPQQQSYAWVLGRGYTSLGQIHRRMEKYDEAERDYHAAIDVLTDLTARFPDETEYAHNLAGAYSSLSGLYQHIADARTSQAGTSDLVASDLAKALEAIQSSLEIRQRPPLSDADNPVLHYALAGDLLNYGGVLDRTGRIDDAAKVIASVIETMTGLHREVPDDTEFALLLAQSHVNLAQLRYLQDRHDEALAAYSDALELLETQVRRAPRERRFNELLGNTSRERAELLFYVGRFEESADEYIRTLQFAEEQEGPEIQARWRLARVRGGADLATEVQQLVADQVANPSVLVEFVVVYGKAAEHASFDENLEETQRRELADQYAARVVELLRQAQRSGVLEVGGMQELLRSHELLDVLRDRDDFNALLKELSTPEDN